MAGVKNESMVQHCDRLHSEQLKNEKVAARAALPESHPNEKITFLDLWENRGVLGFCCSSDDVKLHIIAKSIIPNAECRAGLLIYLLPINFGYEVSTIGKLLAITPFAQRFGHEVNGKWQVAARDQQILNAAGTIGIFVSAFATESFSDIFGRKKTIGVVCSICCGSTVLQYFATTVMMLFGGKVIATFGFGLGHSLGPVFVNKMITVGQWLNSVTVLASDHYKNDLSWKIPLITQLRMCTGTTSVWPV
ncbi:hypothetical protein LZ30DRAFT_691827 [Colletotrichum cereale]|nr:hypothetical protein LZ30DRAFT_691827 [Colletotrichum cereale]